MKCVLTIAGSDSSGGAGIQADLKTMTCLGVYGMSAITALTAQNTTGVRDVLEATPEFVGEQLDCIFEDIRPQAVKIGMVSSAPIIKVIGAKLRQYGAENIVVDPVMVSTSGSALMQDSALTALMEELFPLAAIITPNIPEAQRLCGFAIETEEDMLRAAETIGKTMEGAVLVKGGHLRHSADDLLWQKGQVHWFRSPRVDNPNNHGSGCTLSSAIASFLALGEELPGAVQRPKPTSPPPWRPGWTWARAAAPCGTTTPSRRGAASNRGGERCEAADRRQKVGHRQPAHRRGGGGQPGLLPGAGLPVLPGAAHGQHPVRRVSGPLVWCGVYLCCQFPA